MSAALDWLTDAVALLFALLVGGAFWIVMWDFYVWPAAQLLREVWRTWKRRPARDA